MVYKTLQAKDLRRHYRLRFIASSLEKKAEAAAIKVRLDEDSTREPVIYPTNETCIKETAELERTSRRRPSVAYRIAASAASYAKSRMKRESSNGYELQ